MASKSYDDICVEASNAAESRLLQHFNLHGGEQWVIGTGCNNCRQVVENPANLKKCTRCQAALFCNQECLKSTWRVHKLECEVIATMRKYTEFQTEDESIKEMERLIEGLGSQSSAKDIENEVTAGVAKSLRMDGSVVPGWFFTSNVQQASRNEQSTWKQQALSLYALLRDEACWQRDRESFPRSSYTHVESIPHTPIHQTAVMKRFLELNGHLLVFTAWLQHPEPPATQSITLEERSFFGVVDSILQIREVRSAIDAFMENQAGA